MGALYNIANHGLPLFLRPPYDVGGSQSSSGSEISIGTVVQRFYQVRGLQGFSALFIIRSLFIAAHHKVSVFYR